MFTYSLHRMQICVLAFLFFGIGSCRQVDTFDINGRTQESLAEGADDRIASPGVFSLTTPLPTGTPYYTASIVEATSVNQESVFLSAIKITPPPATDPKTGLRRGQYLISKAPNFGVLSFNVKSNGNVWDMGYQAFPAYSGVDDFQIRYFEPSTTTTPARISQLISVKMKVNKQNSAPEIIGPSEVMAPQDDSSPVIVDYVVVDRDHDPVTVALNAPAGVSFNPKTLQLTWAPGFSKRGTQATLIASDGKVSTSFTIKLGAQIVLSPEKTLYDGFAKTTPFVGYTRYDSNGSNVSEQTNTFFGNFIVYTLINPGSGAATAYNLVSSGTMDLRPYRYLVLSLMYSDGMGAIGPPERKTYFDFYLADVDQGTLSALSRKALAANAYSDTADLVLDLAEMSAEGFDLSKVNALVIGNVETTAKTVRAKISRMLLLGEKQVPLVAPSPKVMFVGANQREIRVKLTDIPSAKITKVVWRLSRFDKPAYSFITTTTPVLPAKNYDGWVGGKVKASVTAGGKTYESEIISVPLAIKTSPTRGELLKVIDDDIVVSATDPTEELIYNNNIVRAMWARSQIVNAPPSAKSQIKLIWQNDVNWAYGVIPYVFTGLSTAEQNLVRQIMDYVMQQTGIIFIPANLYNPRDFAKDPNAVVTFRLMTSSDFSSDAATGNAIISSNTCLVRGIGSGTRLVLLKNTGNNQCLTLSSSGDQPRDSYVRDTLLHELTHVIGAFHEQLNGATSDIKFDRIQPWRESQFEKDTTDIKASTYDPKSVMHYSRYSSSVCMPYGSLYDYSAISKDLDATYQSRIDALPKECQRNTGWSSKSTCLTACETLPKAAFDGNYPAAPSTPNRYSTEDINSLKKLYPLNKLLLDTLAATSTPINVRHANVLASLGTLIREIGANPDILKDPTRTDHILARRLIGSLSSNQRQTPSATCKSGRTDIVSGRRSCNVGPVCLTPSTPGNFFLPIVDKLDRVFSVNETNCWVTFPPGMGSACISATARGGTANGTQGFVSCRATVTEYLMPTP